MLKSPPLPVLQWGRDLTVADRSALEAMAGREPIPLQWGRDLTVADSP